MLYLLDLFGVVVFAITGALAAGRKHLDLFGVVVLALVTALGGGTLRDLILGIRPVFWIADPHYIYVASAAALATFCFNRRLPPSSRRLLKTADAAGLAVFTVIGCQRAMTLATPAVIAVLMGVMTGVVGGMIRDILSGEIPLILRKEIYATAAIAGAAVYVIIIRFTGQQAIATVFCIAVILTLRIAAIHWQLSLPVFHAEDDSLE